MPQRSRRAEWQTNITARAITAPPNEKQFLRAFRPIVYICSPYAGDTEKNTENARKYSRFAVDMHCLPITPHIYFTQFMNDDISEERDTALFMNIILLGKCAELWVFGSYISPGMKAEIDRAKRKHIPIRYFTTDLEECT